MSRSFTSASSEYLQHNAAVVGGYPITMACWVRLADLLAAYVLMSIGDAAGNTKVYTYLASGIPKLSAQAVNSSGSGTVTAQTINAVAGVWTHVCGVFHNTSGLAIYIDGVHHSTNATVQTLGTFNTTAIGTRYTAGVAGAFMNGLIADAAIWNVALSNPASAVAGGEIMALARGVSPLLINPSYLCAYWPLIGSDSPELDRKRRFDLKVIGANPRLSMHMPFQSLQSLQARRHRALNFVGLLGPGGSPPTPGATVFNRQIG